MPNEILLTDTLSLQPTLSGDSGSSVSTCATEHSAGHPKAKVQKLFGFCLQSICRRTRQNGQASPYFF